MRRLEVLATFAILFTLGLAVSGESFAQPRMEWGSNGAWQQRHHYTRMYNPKTVENLTGEVVSIDTITSARGMSYGGVHLTLKTSTGNIPVHLGPAWYIQNQGMQIRQGDKIEVKGSKIIFNGEPTIITATVKKGNQTLTLRDEYGLPAWRGWKHFN